MHHTFVGMRNLGDRKCTVISTVVLLCWLSNWDWIPALQQSSDVVEFGGGFVGALMIVLIGLALRGLAWLYYQITKDSIDNEEEKTSFLEAKYAINAKKLDEVFLAMKAADFKAPETLYESCNPRLSVQRPKKKRDPWKVFLVTEYHFKEGMVFKKSKERNFVYAVAEVLDAELDKSYSQKPDAISVGSLVDLMTNQKPEILVDGE